MIPRGLDVQECLRNYKDVHIVQAEFDWLDKYLQGEYESNEDLIKDGKLVNHKYTLYDVPLQSYMSNKRQKDGTFKVSGFSEYLSNAVGAKGNVGM